MKNSENIFSSMMNRVGDRPSVRPTNKTDSQYSSQEACFERTDKKYSRNEISELKDGRPNNSVT